MARARHALHVEHSQQRPTGLRLDVCCPTWRCPTCCHRPRRPALPAPPARACSYQVRRLADGGDYALKHIDLEAVDPSEYGDLVNEIRLMAAASHPCLPAFYEAFVERNQVGRRHAAGQGGAGGTSGALQAEAAASTPPSARKLAPRLFSAPPARSASCLW